MLKAVKRYKEKVYISYKYLFSYVVILMLAIVFFTVVYKVMYDIIVESTKDNNLSLLSQVAVTVDERMNDIDGMIRSIITADDFVQISLLSSPLDGTDKIIKFSNYYDNLTNYNLISNISDKFIIHFTTSNVLMSADGLHAREPIYDYFIVEDEISVTIEDFFERVEPSKLIILPQNTYSFNHTNNLDNLRYKNYIGIAYSHPLLKDNYANIAMFVSHDSINSLFAPIDVGEDGFSYIIDADDNVVMTFGEVDFDNLDQYTSAPNSSNTIENDKGEWVVSTATSTFTDWTYVSVTSAEIILSKIWQLQNLIAVSFLFFIVITLVLSYFFTQRNLKPIKALFNKVIPAKMIADVDLKNIGEEIDALLLTNRRYTTNMDEHIPIIKNSICKELISGDINAAVKFEEILNSYNIFLNFERPSIILLTVIKRNFDEKDILIDQSKHIVEENIYKIFGESTLYCETVKGQICLIISSTEKDDHRQSIESKAAVLSELVQQSSKGEYILYTLASTPFYNLLKASSHYRSLAINYENYIKNNVRFEISEENSSLQFNMIAYPVELEIVLLASICNGETEKAIINAKRIFDNFYIYQAQHDINNCIETLKNTARRAYRAATARYTGYNFMPLDDFRAWINTVNSRGSIADIKADFLELITKISKVIEDKQTSEVTGFIADVCEYIQKNHHDVNLSLTMLAEKYGVSDPYLSRCFKAYTGQNYTEFLENARIEHAKTLLDTTDMLINDVALKVGYSGSQVFRRTFKKCIGITPNEYRNTRN